MASSDFLDLNDIVTDGVARSGVTAGLPSGPGIGPEIFAFNSAQSASVGCIAKKYANGGITFDFGSSVSAAMVRYTGQNQNGHSVFVFAALNGISTGDSADQPCYMLGLADGAPGHIVLAKNTPNVGLLDGTPGNFGILRKSAEPVALGTWVHLRLEAYSQTNGDVFLRCYRNANSDFSVAPDWQPIIGMDEFVDDITQVNTGSATLTAGPVGFGFKFAAPSLAGAIDHFAGTYQTNAV